MSQTREVVRAYRRTTGDGRTEEDDVPAPHRREADALGARVDGVPHTEDVRGDEGGLAPRGNARRRRPP
mgnify:CR=1 FL=1